MRLATMTSVLLLCVSSAAAQSRPAAVPEQRCPSRWGAADERGAANHMKPETVLKAARLIQKGEVFELGRVLSESMPLNPGRRFEIVTKRTRNDPGANRRGSNEELVVSEIGQVGTQFDTFSHQMIGSSMYNCFTLDETATRTAAHAIEIPVRPGAIPHLIEPQARVTVRAQVIAPEPRSARREVLRRRLLRDDRRHPRHGPQGDRGDEPETHPHADSSPATSPASRRRRSATVAGRSAGSRARHARTAASSADGISGRSEHSVGGSWFIWR